MPLQVLIAGQPATTPGRPVTSRGDVHEVEEARASEPAHARDAPDATRHDRERRSGRQARELQGYREASGQHEEALLRAVDIMSGRPFTLSPETTVRVVRDAFERHRYRHIPVTDAGRILRGIISDRDLWPLTGVDDQPVNRHMVSRVVTASPETTVHEIARALLDYQIGAMPVTDVEQRLVGIITRTDVLRTIVRQGGVHFEA